MGFRQVGGERAPDRSSVTAISRLRLAARIAALVVVTVALPSQAQSGAETPAAAASRAAAACEKSARQTLSARAAKAPEVTFDAAPAIQHELSNESQTVLRGTGRLRGVDGVHAFTYVCNVDRSSFEVVGLVLRDAPAPAAAAKARPAPAPLEPDLRALSPAACESSAVLLLQQRWPQVARISFDSATRTYRQTTAERAELLGSGRAEPTPGATPRLFGFECAIDPRDGRVLRIGLSG